MRFSVNWLKEWVRTDLDAHALAEKLTGYSEELVRKQSELRQVNQLDRASRENRVAT